MPENELEMKELTLLTADGDCAFDSRASDTEAVYNGDAAVAAEEEEEEEVNASVTSEFVERSSLNKRVMSKSRLILLCAASFGTQFLFLLLSVEILPSQIERLAGNGGKGKALGVVAAVGSIVSFVVSPLIGTFSDRSTSKYGRRRPYMAVATIVIIISFVGMAAIGGSQRSGSENNSTTPCNETQPKPLCPDKPSKSEDGANSTNSTSAHEHEIKYLVAYSLFFLIGTACYAIIGVAYNGLIADKVDKCQRGLASGIMGSLTLIGLLVGAGVGYFYDTLTDYGTFSLMYVILAISILITLVSTKETPLSPEVIQERINWRTLIVGYWQPLKEHNFRYVFFTRFLLQMGLSTVVTYLQYWFQDVVPIPGCKSPESAVAMIMLALLVCAAISSVICGYLSDRFRTRKPFVWIAAFAMSACCAALASLPYYYPAIAVACVFGLSYGCYIAVDFALVIDVLPKEKDTAKDLAVWNQALIIPQVIATPIGGLLLDNVQGAPLPGSADAKGCSIGLGYIVVFSVCGLYLLLSSVFVSKIRNAEEKSLKDSVSTSSRV